MAEMVSRIDPKVLKVHPRNAEFFDDVYGAEFDRLVESIEDHGVLIPLRVTKDMTIISGHQRVRAAIQAGCPDVPVIFDESDDENDVLMKLIETNFGRMKNDKVKQAKWLEEYMRLKGVRQGSAGKRSLEGNNSPLKQEDIAKELGVDVTTLKNLKSLLKLDPAFQALISEGKISATTGFKVLAKLSPEDQTKVYGKLPTDMKLSDKAVRAYVEELQQKADEDRQKAVNNTNKAMEENSRLMGENDKLSRENESLRAGGTSPEVQEKLKQLEDERQELSDKVAAAEKGKETLRGICKEYNDRIVELENAMKGGDSEAIQLQNQIDELRKELEIRERKANDLEFQLEEKDDEIKKLKRGGVKGGALGQDNLLDSDDKLNRRKMDELRADIAYAITNATNMSNGMLMKSDMFDMLGSNVLTSLAKLASQAISSLNGLHDALVAANPDSQSDSLPDYDPVEDYDLDDSGLDAYRIEREAGQIA